MIPISSSYTKSLASEMVSFHCRSTIAFIGGLLTLPSLQSNSLRLELLAHLAIINCKGEKKVTKNTIEKWLNHDLGHKKFLSLEDSALDVFVSNVISPDGNYRIFQGIWDSNDYYLQVAIDIFQNHNVPQECLELLKPVFALLQISECVAERLNLPRWYFEESKAKNIEVPPTVNIFERSQALTFSNSDYENLGIERASLIPFIFQDKDKEKLHYESIGHSSLERRPLVDFGDALVLLLPSAISPSIRRYIVSELHKMGYLHAFAKTLESLQAHQIVTEGLRELKKCVTSIKPPEADNTSLVSLHTWLLNYDIDKYIHVVMLHDRLDLLEHQGLTSIKEYSEQQQIFLDQYLTKVASHCQGLQNFTYGITLIITGGLGRYFSLKFNELPDEWDITAISISDLLLLAKDPHHAIKKYLKCIKQKEWAERNGVNFLISTDFNFYSFWRKTNCQLIPRELPVEHGTFVSISYDFILPVRKELRNLVDRHASKTAYGPYVQVMRMGSDALFESMQKRPIYASMDHIENSVLGGVVETSRGANWLVTLPMECTETVSHFIFDIWHGFIDLYDRLLTELESLLIDLPTWPLELQFNFREVIFPENSLDINLCQSLDDPELVFNHEKHLVEIKFPPEFLVLFQKPENTGERYVLKSMVLSLVGLFQFKDKMYDEAFLNFILGKVLDNDGIRLIHIFQTYNPIEYLLAQYYQSPTFLAHEDFVFAKLGLSDDCTKVGSKKILETKTECNDFLHKVVDKIWKQLRSSLKQIDRSSVILQSLAIQEAMIQDRSQWRRTAQAVIALYNTANDVFSIAQEREQRRAIVSISARTIVEMAICESPISDGRQLSQWELDEMLAKAALLIEVATDSDAINGDVFEPKIYLHANGEYTIEKNFQDVVIQPYMKNNYHEMYEDSASDYKKLYQPRQTIKRTTADEVFSSEFIDAFSSEYGLSPDEALEGFGEFMEYALKCDKVIVEIKLSTLRKRLESNGNLTPHTIEAFLKTFGLFSRPAWDKPPVGYKSKELNPWRFRRRLSLAVKPLLVFGENDNDKVIYSVGLLSDAFFNLIERIENGQFPTEFFTSKEMKGYVGAINDERGHLFAKSVEEKLKKNGWNTRLEVQMTELSADSELGDIDILLWNSSGKVLIVECKRLLFAKTVAEVAEICRRFRGEAKDELDKHIKRFEWIKEHADKLKSIIGFIPPLNKIDVRLITSTHVPMMYLNTLPISPDKIIPFSNLEKVK